MNALERRIFDLTNQQRTRRGLHALTAEDALSDAARRYSEDMLRRRFFAHVDPDKHSPTDRIVAALGRSVDASAENIWMRSGPVSPKTLPGVLEDAFAALMASPIHRANVLEAEYTHLGVGLATTASEVRLTQLFARLER